MAPLEQQAAPPTVSTNRVDEDPVGSQRSNPSPHDPAHHREVAVSYAKHGVRIFPCGIDKRPLIKNWNDEATDKLEKVQRWWTKFPDAIVGMPCGPNHLFVVDVDRHPGGADGLKSISSVMPRDAPFPAGMLSVATPNNGFHLWFRMPPVPVKSSAGRLADGVDTRGAGGYVIAPGSALTTGASWKITSSITRAELAEQLVCRVLPLPPAWIVDAIHGSNHPLVRAETALEALRRECAKVGEARQGTRNDTLNRAAFAAGRLVAGGDLRREDAEERLAEAAILAGLEQDEIEKTIASGLSAGMNSPSELPTIGQSGRMFTRMASRSLAIEMHSPQSCPLASPYSTTPSITASL